MSIQFSGADVIDLAVQTEVRGEAFYREAAQKADEADAVELFNHLVVEETKHRATFEGLSSAIVVTEIDPTSWEEASAYIASTVDRSFFKKGAPIKLVPECASVKQMVRQAMEFEKQTLLFFYALRDLVRPVNRPIIDQIIEEEKRHVRRLAAQLAD